MAKTTEQPSYGSYGSYQLTDEQIKRALLGFSSELLEDSDTDTLASNLLCVPRCFTYTTDNSTRENMLLAAEESLMPYIGGVHKAITRLTIKAHKQLVKVGGVQ